MRTAAEIVADVMRDCMGSAESLDAIERRRGEFLAVAESSPVGTIARGVATVVAVKLGELQRGLSVAQFRL